MPLDPLFRKLAQAFTAEATDLSQRLTLDVLELERRPAEAETLRAIWDRVARNLHTLKGSAATVGIDDAADLAHRLEELVAAPKAALAPPEPPVVDALLRSLDAFMARVRGAADGQDGPALDAALALVDAASAPAAPGATEALAQDGAPADAAPADAAPADAAPGEAQESWRVTSENVTSLLREVERLREVRLHLEERHRELERGLHELAKHGKSVETAAARNALARTSRLLAADGAEAADVVRALEEGLKAISTFALAAITEPMHRSVRDLARSQGKRARLSVVGGEVSLDRRIQKGLKDALLHIVRNAVDHGIEEPREREARGKDAEGLVTIRLEQQGNLLLVEVADDGRGLSTEKIREVARQRGLLSADESERLAAPQLHQLVFAPGFTTRDEVTGTSGRGVGLDVVKSRVHALEGQVDVQSTEGQGTRIFLTLPVELGSSPVLLVRSGEHRFGLPLAAVETVRAARAAELRVGSREVHLDLSGELVPVRELGALLALRHASADVAGLTLLVLQAQGQRVALAVDEVLGHDDLGVRALPPELSATAAYQGAATLARGELLLVLRPDWLVGEARARALAPVASGARRALVVDDSLTARALHRAALEAGGFLVHTASDAQQALEHVGRASYDVVVCDVGMSGTDGLALTNAIRQRPATRALPVVLVSAHDAPADRQRGLDAGADAYLSKRECAAGRLLDEVSRAIARRKAPA